MTATAAPKKEANSATPAGWKRTASTRQVTELTSNDGKYVIRKESVRGTSNRTAASRGSIGASYTGWRVTRDDGNQRTQLGKEFRTRDEAIARAEQDRLKRSSATAASESSKSGSQKVAFENSGTYVRADASPGVEDTPRLRATLIAAFKAAHGTYEKSDLESSSEFGDGTVAQWFDAHPMKVSQDGDIVDIHVVSPFGTETHFRAIVRPPPAGSAERALHEVKPDGEYEVRGSSNNIAQALKNIGAKDRTATAAKAPEQPRERKPEEVRRIVQRLAELRGDPSVPITFAQAQENRDRFRREGHVQEQIASVVERWTGAGKSVEVSPADSRQQVRDELARGELDGFVSAVEHGPEAPTLYRSIPGLGKPRAGQVIDARGIASFSEDQNHSERFGTVRKSVLAALEGGHGLPVASISNTPWEEEWLLMGKFRVVGDVTPASNDRTRVRLEMAND